MYLKQLHVENNGPLRRLALDFPFHANGAPKPVVLVGANGSGKTNLQSMIADALFEAAAKHYMNVVPGMTQFSHDWFRILGGPVMSFGAAVQFAVFKFEHDGQTIWYREKQGSLSIADGQAIVAPGLKGGIAWEKEGLAKDITLDDATAEKVFEGGAYVYFPSSRSEAPHWMNREVVPASFDVSARFTKRLKKPIFVEESLQQFAQWLLSVLSDARADVGAVFQMLSFAASQGAPAQQPQMLLPGSVATAAQAQAALSAATEVLRAVLDEPTAQFAWLGRHNPMKLGIAIQSQLRLQGLEALSLGQATLLGMFGTLIRYGDNPQWQGGMRLNEITGICLIDEIDAHMHIELQQKMIPKLIKMFPQVQFVLSSHSPLFVLAMEREFGSDGVALVDMPSGTKIQAEAYSEFAKAFDTLKLSKAFDVAIVEAASQSGRPIVFLEGETDPIYIAAAADLLQRRSVIDAVELKWVGAKDINGNAFHTGADSLNHTLSFLKANPGFVKRRVVLLYDNDKNKRSEDFGRICVRCVPTNEANTKMKKGIENLLPEEVLTDDMYERREEHKGDGKIVTVLDPKKMALCKYLCETKRDAADFANFGPVLDMIEEAAK